MSGHGWAQEILLSDQIGPNELPFHFHGPSHYTTQDKMASILSPELSSPKGRWVDPIHQVDPEDSEEASTRRWPSGCSRQTQEAPSCPEFPEFSGQLCKLAQQLPRPALRGSFVLIRCSVQTGQLTCYLLVGWLSVPCPPPPGDYGTEAPVDALCLIESAVGGRRDSRKDGDERSH